MKENIKKVKEGKRIPLFGINDSVNEWSGAESAFLNIWKLLQALRCKTWEAQCTTKLNIRLV